MIPILFESTVTSFTTNGIGRLSDAISCIVTEERNGPYELEMQYPITGQYFSELQHSRIIYAVPADGKAAQPFRIYRIEKPLDGICTIYAEHISYEMNSIPVMPFTASTCATALTGLGENAVQACPFTFWTNKAVVANYKTTEPRPMRELLGGSQGSILDVFGTGEYEFDGYNVKLYLHRGIDSGVTIRYGKNLVDLLHDETIEDVYTGICPFWMDGQTGDIVTLPEKAVWASTADDFPYKRTVVVDFSQEWQEKPTVSQLRARAQKYLTDNNVGIPKTSITVDFVNLAQYSGGSLGMPRLLPVFSGVVRDGMLQDIDGVASPGTVLVGSDGSVSGDTVSGINGTVDGDTATLSGYHVAQNGILLLNASWELTYEDYKILERLHLCDTVTVVYDALGVSVTAKIVKTVWDVLRGRYEELEIGEPKTTLAKQIISIQEEAEAATDDANWYTNQMAARVQSTLEGYVDHQTELITGGLGGHVVIGQNANGEPEEILIMDTADKATATNVIRMNRNGIGFSTTGYSGPFNSAWTIDGVFNTAFIGAGQITANHLAANSVTAAKIAAGAITAGNISLYGKMGVFTNSSLNVNGGYLGYMTGSADGVDTTGIGLMDTAQDNYLIVTDAGIRATNTSGSNDTEMWMANGLIRFTGTDFRVNSGTVNLNYDGSSFSGTTYANAISARSNISATGVIRKYDASNNLLAYITSDRDAGAICLQTSAGEPLVEIFKSVNGTYGVLALFDANGTAHYLTPTKIDQI